MSKIFEDKKIKVSFGVVVSAIRKLSGVSAVFDGKEYRLKLLEKKLTFAAFFETKDKGISYKSRFNPITVIITVSEENKVTNLSFKASSFSIERKACQLVLDTVKSLVYDEIYGESGKFFNDVSLDSLIDGRAFEFYMADILRKNGYDEVLVTSGSGDYGIDILAEREGIKFAIQCKYYDSPVNNSAVQQASSGRDFYDCHVAVVATNNTFTRSAIETAEKTKVVLWDREKILTMSGL